MTFLGNLLRRGAPGPRGAMRFARHARRLVWRHRVLLAAICCGLAAMSTVQALRPAPPPASPVLVTSRAIAAGAQLTRDDVVLRDIAASLAPPAALGGAPEAVGLTAVVGLPAGVALHPGVLSEGGLLASAPRGTVVVPVTLADDGVAALLRPGDRVDLLAPSSAVGAGSAGSSVGDPVPETSYLARRALVLPTPAERPPDAAGAAGLLGGGADPPSVTLVAVAPSDAPDLSSIAGMSAVSAVLVR
ncbi:hypothetical protein GCM10028784_30440 [Myceligenerans cantabricum]